MAQFLTKKDGKDYLVTDTMENRQKAAAKGLPVYDKLLDPEGNEAWINQNISAKAIREKGYKVPEAAFGEQETYKKLVESKKGKPGETFAASYADSALLGLYPYASGVYEAISPSGGGFKSGVASEVLRQRLLSEANPEASLAGSLFGGVGSGLLTLGVGTAVAGAARTPQLIKTAADIATKTLPRRLATGAATGAAEGLLGYSAEAYTNPLEKTQGQLGKEAAMTSAFGAGAGLLGAAIPEVIQGMQRTKARQPDVIMPPEKAIPEPSTKPLEEITIDLTVPQQERLSSLILQEYKPKEPGVLQGLSYKIPYVGEFIQSGIEGKGKAEAIAGGVSRAKKEVGILQRIVDEDKKLFISEVTDGLRARGLDEQQIANEISAFNKQLDDFNVQEYIIARVNMPSAEPTPLKRWVAETTLAGAPGRGESAGLASEAFALGPEGRSKALEFSAREEAKKVFPEIMETRELLGQGIEQTMEEQAGKAAKAFQLMYPKTGLEDQVEALSKSPANYKKAKNLAKQMGTAAQKKFDETMLVFQTWADGVGKGFRDIAAIQKNRGEPAESNPAWKAIQEGLNYVEKGGGPEKFKLSDLEFYDPKVSDEERFMRLWMFRRVLDKKIDFVRREKKGVLDLEDQTLLELRQKTSDILRNYSDNFANSDRIYSTYKQVLKNIFGEGKDPIDAQDIETVLMNNKSAERFSAYLDDLRSLGNDPLIPQKSRDAINKFLDRWELLKNTSKNKATIQEFERVYGPTGPGTSAAAESAREAFASAETKRLRAIAGEEGPLSQFMGRTLDVAKLDEQFYSKLDFITGKKTTKDLDTAELLALTRTRNYFQNLKAKKELYDDTSLKQFYEAELDKIKKKPTPPNEPPKGPKGGPNTPNEPEVGLGVQGGKFSDRVKEGIKNYVLNRMAFMGFNELAKEAGSEQGINVFEPYKDDLKAYLVSEYGIPQLVADIAVGVLPNNPLELMNTVKRVPRTQWVPNTVRQNWAISKLPDTEPTLKRPVRFAGKNYEHRIYKNENDFRHVLVNTKTGQPEANLRGSFGFYDGSNDTASGLIISGSTNMGPKGLGQKLYELALESHGGLISDVSLSPKGSAKVYQNKLPKLKGVQVTPAARDSEERFTVFATRDNEIAKNAKTRKWTQEEREKLVVPDEQEETVYGYKDKTKDENNFQLDKNIRIMNDIESRVYDLTDNELIILAEKNRSDKEWQNIANKEFSDIPIDYWSAIQGAALTKLRRQNTFRLGQNDRRLEDIQYFLSRHKIDSKLGKTQTKAADDLIKEAKFLDPKAYLPTDNKNITAIDINNYIASFTSRLRQEDEIINLINSKNNEIIEAFVDYLENDTRWWVKNTIKRAAQENKIPSDLAKKLIAS